MKIYVKNMACERCCLMVNDILKNMELRHTSVNLGEIDFYDYHGDRLSDVKQKLLSEVLDALGFFMLSDKKSKLIGDIKISCINYIQNIKMSDVRQI